MPGLLEANTGQRVIFLPEDALKSVDAKSTSMKEEDAKSTVRIIKLPRKGNGYRIYVDMITGEKYLQVGLYVTHFLVNSTIQLEVR